MNQKEARELLKNNPEAKITHEYFADNEFIEERHGNLGYGYYFEDGVKVPYQWWLKDYLETGWSEYKS